MNALALLVVLVWDGGPAVPARLQAEARGHVALREDLPKPRVAPPDSLA